MPHLTMKTSCRDSMLSHCRRKLDGAYLPGEDRNLKAFGLLAGTKANGNILVSSCFPLLHNARHHDANREYMDRMMAEHAIPSETPLNNRGWVADPGELATIVRECHSRDLRLIGAYHMHRVAWEHDSDRDTPTTLDTILGQGSRLIMVIISMVDPHNPKIRAFNEGRLEDEYSIHYI